MIFYKNLKKHRKTAEKNITFSIFGNGVISNQDDLVSKPNECKECYNLVVSDGALKTGLGIKDYEVPENEQMENMHIFDFSEVNITEIRGIDLFRYKNILLDKLYYNLNIIDQNDKIWICLPIDSLDGIPTAKTDMVLTGLLATYPYRVTDFDCILYFLPDGMVTASTYNVIKYDNVPPIISCVVHYDKFFGITNTNRNELVYQSNLNITQWSNEDNSYIEFLDERGVFTKLVTFNDYVYLFREFGITRISEYSNQDEFSFTHLYTSSSRIFENSICVCGDKIFFMARDGLYSFNGSSVTKICENYDKYFREFDNLNCCSCCLNGKYYLATKCNFDDGKTIGCEASTSGYKNNVLIEVDTETEDVNILRGIDIKKIIPVDVSVYSKVVAIFNNDYCNHIGEVTTNEGKIFANNSPKIWKSFTTDLNYQGQDKRVKEVVITSHYPCTIQIISDEESKTYEIDGSEKEQRIPVSVVGKNFQFVFETNQDKCHISKPMIVFDVIS